VVRPSPIAGTLVVSSPVAVRVGATTQSVVYVSLPSNQVSANDKVLITNLASNMTVAPRLLRGGFDPVTIPANLGDVIDVSLVPAPSGPVTDARVTVSSGQPLRVIRTDPINTTDDVEVDATMSVVFSEPLDSARAMGGIRLLRAGQNVPASLSFDSTRTRVVLRPTEALVSGEAYRVDVGDGVVERLLPNSSRHCCLADRTTGNHHLADGDDVATAQLSWLGDHSGICDGWHNVAARTHDHVAVAQGRPL
jgi:hypothetical protein